MVQAGGEFHYPDGWFNEDRHIIALEGDQQIPLTSTNLDDYLDTFGLESLHRSYPETFAFVLAASLILFFVATGVAIQFAYLNVNIERRAKHTTKDQLEKMRKIVAYWDRKQETPEKPTAGEG